MGKNQQLIGIVIFAAGLFILLGKWGVFAFIGGTLWPLIMFLAGLGAYALVRARIAPPVTMVPAGMLTVYGILFMLTHWISAGLFTWLWPLLLIGVGIGLYGYYVEDPLHPRNAWLGSLLFGGVGIGFFILMLMITISLYMIAIALIVVGAGLVFGRLGRRY
ncbi:glutamate synthase [Paenibacillus dendritiformis]|uniref:glutamate synthase n=1 Tax=Paenibacillus dendritiformis TaxID=130049 RepID=UPI0018CD1FFC|nr:glutamate synthase [Paenibacillus dendritiformis]MBG9793821.1 glutamate synthase [Paenibacillus dendritiformis]